MSRENYDLTGQKMQGYTISKPIGQGKFSIVYRAENEQGVAFALKKIKVLANKHRSSTWLIKSREISVCARWRSWRSWVIPTSSSSSIPLSTTINSSLWLSGPKEGTSRSSSRINRAKTCNSTKRQYGTSWGKSLVHSSICTTSASCIETWSQLISSFRMTAHSKLEIWAWAEALALKH